MKLSGSPNQVTKTSDLSKPLVKTIESVKVDTEDKIELERREAYIEPTTRVLLRKLLQGGDQEEIIPIFKPGLGFVYHLSTVAPNENGENGLSRDCLENLARLEILKKGFYDSVSGCPKCESPIMTMHSRCPKCKSHNVHKTSLTEHITCGCIDQREKYINDRCPKCGDQLVEGQYRNMGRWYKCQECGERFETPEYDIACRNCGKNFAIKESELMDIPKFSLNIARKKEIRQNVASLEDIRTLLSELGFNVEIPGLTLGQKSGMQHHFSLIAKKQTGTQEIVVALDHAISETEVQASPLILYIYKTSEIKVDIPIFIAIPQLNEVSRRIAQGHGILLIEGTFDQPQTLANLKTEIQNRIDQQIPQPTSPKQEDQKKPETSSIFNKRGIFKRK
jgi:predicted RNA-binding Zn-ribbon protein involved in translation (DUF1610 family)